MSTPGKRPCNFAENGIRIPASGTGQAHFTVEQGHDASHFRFELSEPPPGITLQKPEPMGHGLVVPIKCDPEKVKPGLKGNLIFILSQEDTYINKENKNLVTSKWVIGTLPAVPFEVASSSRRK